MGDCCSRKDDWELQLLNEFWKIIIREKSANDLTDFIIIQNIKENINFTSYQEEMLIDQFLISEKEKNKDIYVSFWKTLINTPLDPDPDVKIDKKYLIFLCLILLSNSAQKEEMIRQAVSVLNESFPFSSNELKLNEFLSFYIGLISHLCITEVAKINDFDFDSREHLKLLFDEFYVDLLIMDMLNQKDEFMKVDDYIVNEFKNLTNDVEIRRKLNDKYNQVRRLREQKIECNLA